MAIDETRVRDAVRFLRHPRVREAPEDKKVSFLRSKGHSDEEINEAMRRAEAGTSTPATPAQAPSPPQPQAPPPPSVFGMITTVAVLGGIGYGLYRAIKGYVIPFFTRDGVEQQEGDAGSNAQFAEAYSEGQAAQESQQHAHYLAEAQQNAEIQQELIKTMTELRGQLTKLNEDLQTQRTSNEDQFEKLSKTLKTLETSQPRKEQITAEFQKISLEQVKTSRAQISELQKELKDLKDTIQRSTVKPETPASAPASASSPAPAKLEQQEKKPEAKQPENAESPSQNAPYSPSFTEILGMVQNGVTPPDVKQVNDKPSDPTKPPPAARREPNVKPWERKKPLTGKTAAENAASAPSLETANQPATESAASVEQASEQEHGKESTQQQTQRQETQPAVTQPEGTESAQ